MTHNDVIMGNMEGLVTLLFFKIKSLNLASWGILMQIFQKVIYFQIESFYDVSIFFLTKTGESFAHLDEGDVI